jgi:hypothetical protein
MSDSFNAELAARFEAAFSSVPSNIYESLHTVLRSLPDATLAEANVAQLTQTFPIAFEDYEALIDASLHGLPSVAGAFPRLDSLIAGKSSWPIPEIATVFNHLETQHMIDTLTRLNNSREHELASESVWAILSDSQRNMAIKSGRITLSQMLDPNQSQNVRSMQLATWASTNEAWGRFVDRFEIWCWEHEFPWSLRPPLAMSHSHYQTLESISYLAGIPIPSLYMSRTMQQLMDNVADDNRNWLFDYRFGHRSSTDSNALWAHESYRFWSHTAAHAIARVDSDEYVLVTPACLPPWLAWGFGSRFPVYMAQPEVTGTNREQIAHMILIHPEQIPHVGELGRERVNKAEVLKLGRGMNLVCLGMSLMAAQIRLGSGHKRPQWTQTQLNPTTLRFYMRELAELSSAF